MLVHSCYVDNGFGDRVDILDENGCGLDAVIFWKKKIFKRKFFL